MIEAIGACFHEHHADIVRWAWKLFCAKWARMLEVAEAERQREQERERERTRQHLDAVRRKAMAESG
ncbi:MAG TPA: hypothetical protein VKQ30_01215 [Ktedonobacterales bacterium]|nr:hypothetical protein [Ktedonobacterales bacterium]